VKNSCWPELIGGVKLIDAVRFVLSSGTFLKELVHPWT
jgi:hypothetical protein